MTNPENSGADHLRAEGYAHLPGAIGSQTVKALRETAEGLAFRSDGVGLTIGATMSIPGLEKVIFAEPIMTLARGLLGERISLFPNITLRRNTQTPWHVDDAFRLPVEGWEDADRVEFLQVTVYLQSNGETGGGLDVVPRSHRLEERAGAADSFHAFIATMRADAITVPSHAGDAVLWDGRLMHRSTPSARPPAPPNYAIHWTFSDEGAGRVRFLDHLLARGANERDATGVDRRYSEIRAFSFDSVAGDAFLARAGTAGVTLFDAARADAQR